MTIGAVVITRHDNYGGDACRKLLYALSSLISELNEVILVDWNSPDRPALEEIREQLPKTGKLRHIVISPELASQLAPPDSQACVEVLARNIGLRRLESHYLISTNQDVMCGPREDIENGILGNGVFHCIARREIPLFVIPEIFTRAPGRELIINLMGGVKEYGIFGQHAAGSPLGPEDQWSLITCPGDFQLAHRDIWHAIRGFEESLTKRGYSDSNIQRKAKEAGFGLELVRNIPAFHFTHYPDTGSTGGAYGSWNERDFSLMKFAGTTNPDTWGFSDMQFLEETI